jgi:CheY-specific phosphatase CheX
VSEPRIQHALQNAVHEVLEKMFFVQALGKSPDPTPAEAPPIEIAARLTFQGEPSGSLSLRLTYTVAQSIAADFLGAGEDEVSALQVAEVVCEIANMICGSVLSRVESGAPFQLAAPQIVPPSKVPAPEPCTTFYAVDLSNGSLAVGVTIGTPTCPEPAQSVS